MELSVRNRIYLSIAALLLASGALGYFIIYPAVIQIIETAAKMEETRMTIEKNTYPANTCAVPPKTLRK